MEKSPEGISTEFSGEDWQINSSPFPKISKFTYDIGKSSLRNDSPSGRRPQDVGVDNRYMETSSGEAIEVLILNFCLGRVQHFSDHLGHFGSDNRFHKQTLDPQCMSVLFVDPFTKTGADNDRYFPPD